MNPMTETPKHTKLQVMLSEAIGQPPDSPEVTAAINTMADWFEIVISEIGLMPNIVPTLLRWQYLQGQLMEDDE